MRTLLLLVAAIALVGCKVSRYAERGDAAMAVGEYRAALANYEVAVTDHPSPELRRRHADAAVAVTRAIVLEAEAMRTAGDLLNAAHVVWSVVHEGGWGVPAAVEIARTALRETTEHWLGIADRSVEAHRYDEAAAIYEQVMVQVPNTPIAATARDRLAAMARTFVERADGALPHARRFRLLLAERYGADVRGALVDVPGFASTGTATAECAPFLSSRPASSSSSDVVLELRLEQCTVNETKTAASEVYRYQAVTERRVPTEITRYEEVPLDPSCAAAKCTRYDPLGVCIDRDAEPACQTTKRQLVTRASTTVEYGTKTATATRVVHRRTQVVTLRGTLVVRAGDITETTPVQVTERLEDSAYWSPHGQRLFSHDPVDVLNLAKRRLSERVRAEGQAAVTALAGVRFRAAATGDDDALEDALVSMVQSKAALDDAGAAFFREAYGLGPVGVRDVIDRRRRPVPQAKPAPTHLTPARLSRWEHRWFEAAVRAPEPPEGPPGRTGGLDVYGSVEGSPLASASRAHGVGLRVMSSGLQLGLRGMNANLGGDVGGYGVDLTVLHDLPWGGLTFFWRLLVEETRTDGGEATRFVGAPIGLSLALGRLSLEAGFGLNLFALQSIGGRNPDEPDYVLPVHIGASVDATRWLFVRATLVHYFNTTADEPVHGGVQFGVRL